VSAQSKKSAVLLSTDSALELTLAEILTLTSTWPAGMPGIFIAAQRGLSSDSNDALGTMLVVMYGPTPGGGLLGSFLNGVPVGMIPSAGNASTLSNGP